MPSEDMQDYHSSFTTPAAPAEAFKKIEDVSGWWARQFEGSASKPGDVFTVRFDAGDWYTIKIAEVVPGRRIVWDVIGSEQLWHEDHDEWTGTQIIWEVSPEGTGSQVTMTHLGLTPAFECYDNCKLGWDYLVSQSLRKYLNEGAGLPV